MRFQTNSVLPPNKGRRTTDYLPARKPGAMVKCPNRTARALVLILDYEPACTSFTDHVFPFLYQPPPTPSGGHRPPAWYTATFHAVIGPHKFLIECTSHSYAESEAAQMKYSAIVASCPPDYRFVVVTDQDVQADSCYVRNLEVLTQFSRYPVDAPTRALVSALLDTATETVCLGHLTNALVAQQMEGSPGAPSTSHDEFAGHVATARLMRMVWDHELLAPLSDWSLSTATPIWLPYQLDQPLLPHPLIDTLLNCEPAYGYLEYDDGNPMLEGGNG